MDRFVFHNDRIIEANECHLAPTTAGLLYGWGVFTTIRVYAGDLFAFERHWDRLVKHAERARIAVPLTLDRAHQAALSLIATNSTVDGRVRITLLRGSAGAWKVSSTPESELLVFTASEPRRVRRALAITVSPYRVLSHGPLAGVKRTAMVENVLALDEAKSRGFAEAVMCNERGEIAGATSANIFWAEGPQLFTPSLATGCIPGITRGFVLEIASRLDVAVTEGSFPLQRLLDATEVFVTSTVREIALVSSFDIKEYDPNRAMLLRQLRREFQKATRGVKITR
jgi:branched-subunit amino acid aminotransferase/4-amino-4-deoxychorismate lyase